MNDMGDMRTQEHEESKPLSEAGTSKVLSDIASVDCLMKGSFTLCLTIPLGAPCHFQTNP
jgi:hypothetical protein